MKKITILFTVVVCIAMTANAQEQGQIRFGGGLAFGTKAGVDINTGLSKLGAGISLGGEYFVSDVISLAPSYTFSFKTDLGDGDKYSLSSFDINGRYYFATDDIQFYGLAGLAFTSSKFSFVDGTINTSSTGFNLGVGLLKPISDNLSLNGLIKLQTFKVEDPNGNGTATLGTSQLVFGVGVVYSL